MEIKFFKKQKKFRKGGFGIKPDLYWRYIFCVTAILVFSSCVFGLYLFLGFNKELIMPAINIDEQNTIKKERLEKVLEYFKECEKKSIEILNSPSPIVDPSL